MNMEKMKATAHAQKRMQQRAISAMQIKLIEVFGESKYQKGGTYLASVPRKILVELRHAIDKLPKIAVVYGDSDKLVTVMHEKRRINKTQYTA